MKTEDMILGDRSQNPMRYLNIPAALATLLGLYVASRYSYPLFHSLAELFSIVIAIAVFIIAWNCRRYLDNDYLLLIGIAYLFVGCIDLVHTLAYRGMGVFPDNGSNLATSLWIIALYLESISLLVAPMFVIRRLKVVPAMAGYLIVSTLVLLLVFTDRFPVCYVEGAGLTQFKKVSEYIISLILLSSMILLIQKRRFFEREVLRLLVASIIVTIFSELSFTFYAGVYDFTNLLGHYFKIASFYLIYLALIKIGFTKPFNLLFREIKQMNESLLQAQAELEKSRDELEVRVRERTAELHFERDFVARIAETSPIGIVVTDSRGKITFANQMAERILGLAEADLAQRTYNGPDWTIKDFNGGPFPEAELPLARAKSSGEPVFDVRHAIEWPDGRRVLLSINAAPIFDAEGNFDGMVASVADITERQQTEAELGRKNRALLVLSECNEALIREDDEKALLERICRIIVDDGGYRMAWVGYAGDDSDRTVRPVAWSGREEGYLESIRISWADNELGRGPTGTAIRTGRIRVARNFLTDPDLATWRDEAVKRGYCSSIALPLMIGAQRLGAVNIYASEPDAFDEEEVKLLQQMSEDLSYGIVTLRGKFERARVEKARAESEIKFRTIFEHSRDAIGASIAGRHIMANPAYLHMFGYKKESELIGTPIVELITPAERGKVMDNVQKRMQGREAPRFYETRGLKNDGTEFDMDVSISTCVLEGETCTLVMLRDITERKQSENDLKDRELFLSSIIINEPECVKLVDSEGTILFMNPAGLKMIAAKNENDVFGKIVYGLIAKKDRDDFQKFVADVCNGNKRELDFAMNDMKGKEHRMNSIAVPLFIRDQNKTVLLGITRDVTEQINLEESLRQSQKMESVGRLAGGVAHDFNNFLTAVEGYIDLTLLDLPGGGPARENLLEARHAAERAADLTRQLLIFSRRQPLELKLINLNVVITELLKMLDRLIGEQYAIDARLDDTLPAVKADAGHIEQVLMNLVVNARDAMTGGGAINISTAKVNLDEEYVRAHAGARPGEFACFSVSDTGSGMDSETLSHIYEPFFSTKESGLGTGLGLSVVYSIVAEHGGWIEVESRPESGSTFSVFLPAVRLAVAGPSPETAPIDALRGHGEKILLVEDEEPVRTLAEKMLSGHGYTVVAAATAEEALDIFETGKPDLRLVFSDVILPGMTGISLAEKLLEHEPGLHILLASGFVEDADYQRIRDRGFRFLEKPYILTDLLRQVKELLAEPR